MPPYFVAHQNTPAPTDGEAFSNETEAIASQEDREGRVAIACASKGPQAGRENRERRGEQADFGSPGHSSGRR
jgi:hypothetical protein